MSDDANKPLLGTMLLEYNIISKADLDKALEIQKNDPSRLIGEIFVDLNLLDDDKLIQFLDKQLEILKDKEE